MTAAGNALRAGLLALSLAFVAGCATPPPVAEPPVQPLTLEQLPPGELRLESPPTVVAAAAPAATRRGARLPRSRIDPQVDSARGDLWQRVRDGFAIPDLDGERVRTWEQYYAQRPDYVQRMAERGSRYLYYIVEELDSRGLPTDLALLPFVESAFDPQALSAARAAGMWQFMPATGRDFELKQNLFRDDRRDVQASTRAALDYLQRLHAQFDDWHLALAAYNWGQGNVLKAQARNARARRGSDYGSLRMPDETRNYVPKLQAIKNIIARPHDFGLELPPLDDHPYFMTVPIERDIDVALAARLSGLSLEQFRQLNPQLNKPVILASVTPQVLLPYDAANRFVRELAAYAGPLSSWTAWVAPRTLKPTEAARRVGMDEDELRQVNRIPARMLVKVGSTLIVPRTDRHTEDVPEHVADGATMALAPEGPPRRRIRIKVGKGGASVATLARRYGMEAAQLADVNGVSASARFKPGQFVTVLVAQRAPAKTRRGRAARRAPPAAASTQARRQTRVKKR